MNKIYEKLCLIFQIILFFIFKIKTKTFRIFVKLTDLWEYIDSPAICNTKNFTYITLYFMKFISFLWHLGPLLMRITYHLCSCLLPLWCSNLATKIFLPNMPWFLHTCTSLPIPVYSSWNTFSFCIWEVKRSFAGEIIWDKTLKLGTIQKNRKGCILRGVCFKRRGEGMFGR